jgi:hypothetical protein
MRRTWLLFSQAVTIAVAVMFVRRHAEAGMDAAARDGT